MKKILLPILCSLFPLVAFSFPYDQYPEKNLGEVIQEEDKLAKNEGIPLEKRFLYLPAVRYSSIVTYTGESREVQETNKNFLSNLIKSMPFIPQKQIDLYTKEVLIKADEKEIWALIQTPVYPHLAKELKAGDKLLIYYFWFGANKSEHIIAINEFSSNVKK